MIVQEKHGCNWPGCTAEVSTRFWACKRHWDMLPGKLRGWILSTFDNRASGEGFRASNAARSWARNHPDPSLPPFEPGQLVTGRPGTMAAGIPYTVAAVSLVPKAAGKDATAREWVVKLEDGSGMAAADLVPHLTESERA